MRTYTAGKSTYRVSTKYSCVRDASPRDRWSENDDVTLVLLVSSRTNCSPILCKGIDGHKKVSKQERKGISVTHWRVHIMDKSCICIRHKIYS
jgi:hypothetical protein